MRSTILLLLCTCALALVSACGVQEKLNNFKKNTDAQFGDQHFKSVIALIELHKTRFGTYPDALSDLKYIGDWDKIALASVSYAKLDSGYELNVVRGWVGTPELHYPPDFWQGLGLLRSNMKTAPQDSSTAQ